MIANTPKLALPSPDELSRWLDTWHAEKDNSLTVSSVRHLFDTFPTNTNLDEILAKVAALDKLYSTSVRYPHDLARHIFSIPDLTLRLARGDISVVAEISNTPVVRRDGTSKTMCYYSIATKYCAFSNPFVYSIYDSYVDRVLTEFNHLDPFFDAKKMDLRHYSDFDAVLDLFREKYSSVFENVSRVDMDKYLWILGKTLFPKHYKRKSE